MNHKYWRCNTRHFVDAENTDHRTFQLTKDTLYSWNINSPEPATCIYDASNSNNAGLNVSISETNEVNFLEVCHHLHALTYGITTDVGQYFLLHLHMSLLIN